MELRFIKYSALIIVAAVIGLAGIVASSSTSIVAYDKTFGLISSLPTTHMISVSSKLESPATLASTRSSNSSSQSGAANKVAMINFDDGYKSQLLYA